MMKYSPYSFSKLATHKHCNRKFKYNYIDKAPKDKMDMTALLKGGAVHSILEHYPNESSHKLAPKYQHIADKFIVTNLGEKYLTQDSIREFDFGLTMDLMPTSYSDKEALFRGSVDFICTIDDVLHLCDWKTGKYKEPKWQEYDQLMFYGIYFFQRYPTINTIKISYVYIEHEDHENTIELQREYLTTYVNQLLELIKNVETDEVFEKSPGRLCEWCDFKTHCSSDI
jgi:CRISPR/Cas system-associated exonuclease Cas4 (RecB family)